MGLCAHAHFVVVGNVVHRARLVGRRRDVAPPGAQTAGRRLRAQAWQVRHDQRRDDDREQDDQHNFHVTSDTRRSGHPSSPSRMFEALDNY